jgi:hypothetical protein
MEPSMKNEIDHFSHAIDAIDRVPRLQKIGGACEGEIPQRTNRLPRVCLMKTASIGQRLRHGSGRTGERNWTGVQMVA